MNYIGESDIQIRKVGPNLWAGAFVCQHDGCGKPVSATSEDRSGMFTGTCQRGHVSTIIPNF